MHLPRHNKPEAKLDWPKLGRLQRGVAKVVLLILQTDKRKDDIHFEEECGI